MRHHLATPEGKAADGLRTCTGEPTFGIIKQLRRFPAIPGAGPQKRQGRMGIGAPGVHAEAEGGLERRRKGKEKSVFMRHKPFSPVRAHPAPITATPT